MQELRNHRVRQAESLLKLGIRLSEATFVVAQADGSPLQPRSLTHATAMLKSRVHPKIVQERLGHSTIAITMDIYSHVLEGMQEGAVEMVDAALQAALIDRRKEIG